MSDTSRKRSRKSKLVPRECSAEDDVELQAPILKVLKINTDTDKKTEEIAPIPLHVKHGSFLKVLKVTKDILIKPQVPEAPEATEACNKDILKKLSATVTENLEPSPPIKFDIEVEVEQCDDDDNVDMPNEDTEKTQKNKPVRQVVLTYKDEKKTGHNKHISVSVPFSAAKVLQAADNIIKYSTNPADRILDIGVRNSIGHDQKEISYSNKHEKTIQEILDGWKTWQYKSFHRDAPLFYKCYVCKLSWWSLSEFRDHVTKHPSLKMALEQYGRHEVNLVAYTGRKIVIKDIYAEGFCNKCGNDYHAHKLSGRYQRKFYKSNSCVKSFYTCIGLQNHFTSCTQCKVGDRPIICQICRRLFNGDFQLQMHLGLCHTVRSDIPILSRYSTCKICSARYFSHFLHYCGKRGPQTQCRYCFLSYPSRTLTDLHMENSSEPYKCDICGQVMLWNCKVYEHMMTHSDKYILVRKCVICEDFKVFLSNDAALTHRYTEHLDKDTKHTFITRILVPKSCIDEYASISETEPLPASENEAVPGSETKLEPGSEEAVPVPKKKTVAILKPVKEDENITIKEEPIDTDDHSMQIVVKEEVLDPDENPADEDTSHWYPDTLMSADVQIKQEYNEEEYEDDIIKLEIDIDNTLLIPKQELVEESQSQEYFEIRNRESPVIVKQECMTDPDTMSDNQLSRQSKIYTCGRCGFRAYHKKYKEHIEFECTRSSAKDRQCFCTKCNKEYPSMKKYLGHFVNHGYDCLSCPECLTKFYSFSKLLPHVQSHIKQTFVRVKSITQNGTKLKPEYQCKKCNESVAVSLFFDHWELHVHSSPQKAAAQLRTKAKYHELQGIQEEIINESLTCLSRHTKQCNQCQRKFNRINECKRHIIEHLLTDAYNHKQIYGELRCQKCGLGFMVPEKYKQHMRDHASLPVYRCELCDRTFSDSSNFTKHKKVHNLKVFVCDLCGKKFQSKFTLEKHVIMHATSKPIKCEVCDKVFYFDSSYRRHVRYFHERVTTGFRCVICNERFPSLKLKWNHMWDVHKERKHKADCPICFKSFRKYTDVRAHAKAEHNKEVSVYSVKNATKPMIDIQNYLKNTTTFKIGEVETLVVYE